QGRPLLLGVLLDRDAAAVIAHAEAAVDVNANVDEVTEPGQRLVNAVGDQLVDEVVQPLGPRVTDVHAGALADVVGIPKDVHAAGDVLRGRLARGLFLGRQRGLGKYDAFFAHRMFPQPRPA